KAALHAGFSVPKPPPLLKENENPDAPSIGHTPLESYGGWNGRTYQRRFIPISTILLVVCPAYERIRIDLTSPTRETINALSETSVKSIGNAETTCTT
ncbi:hypothetical protein N7453_004616, partial [Penicillium expansum]